MRPDASSVLRTLLLPRELLKKRGSSVAVRFGPHVRIEQTAGNTSASHRCVVRQVRGEPCDLPIDGSERDAQHGLGRGGRSRALAIE